MIGWEDDNIYILSCQVKNQEKCTSLHVDQTQSDVVNEHEQKQHNQKHEIEDFS